jgi:cytochrome c-type biogenesis protein CcsB
MKKFLMVVLLFFGVSGLANPGDALRYLPVQDAGRVKPYDTFAREILQLVYGKQTYEKREAYEIILTWMLTPADWQDRPLFEVRHKEVLKQLKLDPEKRWYTGKELFDNEIFPLLREELRAKQEAKEKLTPYLQALQRIDNQYSVFQSLAMGELLRIVPPKEGTAWISVAGLEEPHRSAFLDVTKNFVAYLGAVVGAQGNLTDAGNALDASVIKFEDLARQQNPQLYAQNSKINTEVFYNLFHPFKWAYLSYLIAAILILIMWISNKPVLMKPAWAFVILGFLIHTYGFSVRIYLAGRPPVSNMYETVVWVAWGSVLFACVLEYIYKYRYILFAGSLVGMFALIVADSAPAVLDPSLQPLEAVLNSNYWLIIHVMPITISYAAFFLAFVLGDIALVYYLKGEEKFAAEIKQIVLAIYRCIQIGVVFLAPGIVLGGLWADVSWGRFWGWDPKETWALIVLLGYIAVLHGRLTSWIKDFGMVASAVLSFNLVIMAWYGVNFVLGAGFHSYGWGAGGIEYVAIFCSLHLLYLVYVFIFRKSRQKATAA